MTGYWDHVVESGDNLHIFVAKICGVLLLVFLLAVLAVKLGGSVDLQIIGHSAGDGLHSMQFAGDMLNVTLTNNSTGWLVTGSGSL